MKNHYILILASLAFALASCTDLQEQEVNDQPEQNRMLVSASIAGNPDTKTHMGEFDGSKYPVLWSENDEFALFYDDLKKTTFTIDSGWGTTQATFGGNASKIVGPLTETTIYPAAYPAAAAFISTEAGTGSVWVGSEVPYLQSYKSPADGGFDDNTFPMAAATTDPLNYDFYNMAGIVQVRICYSPSGGDDADEARIRQIILKGNKREQISGGVAMQFNYLDGSNSTGEYKDNGRAVKACGEAYENVMIDLSGIDGNKGLLLSKDSANPTTINIAVIPQWYEEGFTIELQDASNHGTSTYVTGHKDLVADPFGKTIVNDSLTVRRSEVKQLSIIQYMKPEPLSIANCYILSEPGDVLVPAYAYGNRMDIKIGLGDPEFDLSKLEADIYWTDIVNGDGSMKPAITNLRYLKYDDGVNYLMFRINEDPNGPVDPKTGRHEAYRGNVIIALYNPVSNKIFWTWHVWLCEQPKEVVIDGACAAGSYSGIYPDGTPLNYEAEAAAGTMIILDRNVGAIYATPEEAIRAGGQAWQTYGMYYQDGRKDPFIGGKENGTWDVDDDYGYPEDEKIPALHLYEDTAFGDGTHPTWTNPKFTGWRTNSGNITLTNAIRDPHLYSFDSSKNGTWQWTDCDDPDNQSWMTYSKYPKVSTHGETGLTYGGHEAYWNRTKTIMDPCPPGYSVLGERGGYYFGGKGDMEWHGTDAEGFGLMYHYTYGGTTYNIWWPAAGVRAWDGRMAGLGKYGFYFFYDHITADHGGHGVIFKISGANAGGKVTDMNKDAIITNHATPMRCVREKQFGNLEKYPIKDEAYYINN